MKCLKRKTGAKLMKYSRGRQKPHSHLYHKNKLQNILGELTVCNTKYNLKVPKREIFDRSDFPDFYTIKYSWVGDLVVKILTYYFNF